MVCIFFVAVVFRRIIDGPLDVHPSRPAIVVHYEVEATVISEYGEPMVADKKQAKKMYTHTHTHTHTHTLVSYPTLAMHVKGGNGH